MQKMTINELMPDGMRRMKIVGDTAINPERYVCFVPLEAREHLTLVPARDDLLGLHSLELTYPIFEPFDFMIHSPKRYRRLMVVHYAYGSRVSECIQLAWTEFFARTKFAPMYSFVKNLPADLDGTMLNDCIVLEAEWMPARCAAVGGCYVG
jgi:hypothetical protein